ncbi:MAG TPA: hypothetical protein EYO39_00435 [Nitrospirales bacterium]|nr:hypothetical protein [Nitrospirales bacterium]
MNKHTSIRESEGVALILVIILMLAIGAALTIVALQGQRVTQTTNFTVNQLGAEEAAKGGIDIAVEQFWGNFWETIGNTTGNLASYRDYLDDLIAPPPEGDESAPVSLSNGPSAISYDNPIILAGVSRVTGLSVTRRDDATGSDLTFRAVGSSQQRSRTLVQTVRIGGAPFSGFDFAILANNITCILCHTEIDSVERFNNTDSDNYNTYDRVKIAALESLMVRTGSGSWGAETNVAGTTYTRGQIYDNHQSELSPAQVEATTFDSYPFADPKGTIEENSSGNMFSPTSLVAGAEDAEGNLEQLANLYMNYPTDSADMTDGDLPNSFPPPFPDDNGNRFVDDSEFAPFMSGASGSVTGGVIVGVPPGQTYSGNALPTSSTGDVLDAGNYTGNVILVGTEDNPIILNGEIAIDGDLMISGVVQGTGELQVRGNTYVMGDVTYADADGEYGQFSNNPEDQNLLGISSGGSIMIGDYNTVRALPYDDHKNRRGRSTARDGFYWDRFRRDLHIDYQNRHASARDRQRDTQEFGYFDDVVDDGGIAYMNGDDDANPVSSFTSGQLMLFNRLEHAKAADDPDYTPRYYQLRETAPIWEYLGDEQHTDWYDNPELEEIAGGDLDGAAIHDLSPSAGWISEDQLREMWYTDELSRTGGRPFQLDGLLYTNNAIFAEVHSKEFHNSDTNGEMIIRGGIVAADLGMLIPGKDLASSRAALTMLYDPRVSNFMSIEDTSAVVLTRRVFRYES